MTIALLFVFLPQATAAWPSSLWATAGSEHAKFRCVDTDHDGFDDVVVEKLDGKLLVSLSVKGWKAAPWRDLAVKWDKLPPAKLGGESVVPAPPPYQVEAELRQSIQGDLNGDGALDTIGIYHCTRPGDFLELRAAFGASAVAGGTEGSRDSDDDELTDEEEAKLGTDVRDRDSDADGLLDGWEVHGLPRGISIGEGSVLNPLRQDVVVAVAPYAQIDRNALPAELEKAAALYRSVPTKNPDGSSGIWLHFRLDASIPEDRQHGGSWAECGNEFFPARERGLLHWMQVTPWGGGQSQQTGDMGGCGNGFAVFAHEFGHQMSLGHEGDSPAAWCPLYPSLMSYAFSYSIGGDGNAIHFSSGRFRDAALDESKLVEHLPYPHAELKYLEAGPFRFRLEDDGAGGTRIDWNQNGRFDEGTVSADVNYGGSTYCGVRRNLDLIGAAPSLAYVGETCFLATLDQNQGQIQLREYHGSETWGEKRGVPSSATDNDPLLIGTPKDGYVLFRRALGWYATRFDAQKIEEPQSIPGLDPIELGGGFADGRVLLIERRDDDSLSARWFTWTDKPAVSAAQPLEVRSRQPVAFAQEPRTKRIALATAMPSTQGYPHSLRVSWLRIEGDILVHEETRWVQGEKSGTGNTTRPVVVYADDGSLNVFHTGGPDASGQMIAYRTRRIGNRDLNEGWLTCMLYDIWTRTRRALAFANGPQGAIYAFRWDSGEYGETHINHLLCAYNGFGIDAEPMRDFDDGAKMSRHGIVHSILWMNPGE